MASKELALNLNSIEQRIQIAFSFNQIERFHLHPNQIVAG